MAFPIAPSVNDVYVNGGVQYKWNGYAWDVVNTIGTASMFTYEYIATAGQTVFNVNYYAASKYLDVYLNGVRLANSEYTAVDGSTVVLTVGATIGDVFTAKVYDMVEFTDALTSDTAYTKAEVQASLPKVGFDTANVTAPSTGQLAWNAADRTLDIGLGNGVTLQAGQETVYLVRNATGSQIDDGTVVVASGVTAGSGRISVSKAIADGSISATKLVGIATENIANGVNGVVTSFGYVRGLDTRGTTYGETWAEGDILYVSQTTAGRLTNVMPVSGQKIIVAMVIVVHATSGVVFVRASNIDENKWAEINDATVSATATWSSQKIDADKQDTLVSGTNIATVNGEDLTQGGNVEININTKPYEILASKSISFDYTNSTLFVGLYPKALELESGKFFIYGTPDGSNTASAFIYDSVANTFSSTTVVASSNKALAKAVKISNTSILFISSIGTDIQYKILTIAGGSISVGTTSTITIPSAISLASGQDCGIEVTELDIGKYILSYTDSNTQVWVQGFTVTGDTVTFGTAGAFNGGGTADKVVVFKISTTKAAIFASTGTIFTMRVISVVGNVITSLVVTSNITLTGRFIAYQLPSGRFVCVYNTTTTNTTAALFTYDGESTISISSSIGVITGMAMSGIILHQVGNTILLAGSTSINNTKCTAITDTEGVFTRVDFTIATTLINYGVYLVGRRQDGMFFRIKTTANCFQIYKLEYKNNTPSLIPIGATGFSTLELSDASAGISSYNTEDNILVSLKGSIWSLCLGAQLADRCVFVNDTQVLSEFTPLGYPLVKTASCRLYDDTALLFTASIKANTYEIQVIKVL